MVATTVKMEKASDLISKLQALLSMKAWKLKTKQQELLIRVSILLLVYVLAFITRLFSVLRYESMIHEFDPYFNYRTTLYLTQNGFYEFWNWFDSESWYPLGRIIGGTLYPGFMVTAAIIYWTLRFLRFFTFLIFYFCLFFFFFFYCVVLLNCWNLTYNYWEFLLCDSS